MMPLSVLAAVAVLLVAPAWAWAAGPVAIVAAENFYGDVAQQVGGPDVTVTSILSNPDEDPHLFEASPAAARAISAARILIYNGIGYDPWAAKLAEVMRSPGRKIIVVAHLIDKKPGDNPHIWYDPATMPVFAETLAGDLSGIDPAHRAEYQQRLARFQRSLRPILARIAALRRRLAGTPVTATEPVFGSMLQALGMRVLNPGFQLAVMNNTEPSASEIAAFENDLAGHRVRMLLYNGQATDPIAKHMLKLAGAAHIPVVAVTETEPPGNTYQQWITGELDAVGRALAR
jgi:zinc/manganese transport system substrate-binding protein